VGDIEGTVQAVETRATLVKTFAGKLVIIPNTDIYTNSVTVNTAYDLRRVEIMVPVGMGADLGAAIEVFRNAAASVEHVLGDPPVDVLPWEFSQNNVNIRVRWWTKSQRTYEVRTRAAVVAAIKRAAEEAQIDIPPDTTISFAETPLIVSERKQAKRTKKPSRKLSSSAVKATEEPDPTQVDARQDPEAEKPKLGELNEGLEEVPR
jgi:small-conductance mechanosensitive channel